jgi:hypothetical protein
MDGCAIALAGCALSDYLITLAGCAIAYPAEASSGWLWNPHGQMELEILGSFTSITHTHTHQKLENLELLSFPVWGFDKRLVLL